MDPAETLPDVRVEAAWIASHVDDPMMRFVEIDVSAAAYNAGHIPGAVLWNAYTDLRHSNYRPVSAVELRDLLRKSGVTPDMTKGVKFNVCLWHLADVAVRRSNVRF
jgi:thiosulfate/3-mercaptopyruvate sulfurtransferase